MEVIEDIFGKKNSLEGLKLETFWLMGPVLWMMVICLYECSLTEALVMFTLYLGMYVWYDGSTRRDQFPEYPLPPGPRPWPLIGNLCQLGPLPFQAMTRFYRKYGPVYRLKLGSRDVVIISGSATLRKCFAKSAFQNRPDFAFRRIVAKGRSITFNDLSPGWIVQKKCAARALAEFLRRGEVERLTRPAVDAMCQDLIREGCSNVPEIGVVQPMDACKTTICKIMISCCFGTHHQLDDICHHWQQTLNRMQKRFPVVMMLEFFPWLKVFLSGLVKRLTLTQRSLSQYMLCLAQKASMSGDKNQQNILHQTGCRDNGYQTLPAIIPQCQAREDLGDKVQLAGLLSMEGQRLGSERLTALGLSEEQLLLSLEDMVGAAGDTTGSFLQWAILYLAKFPAIQDRLLAEIQAVPESWATCAYVRSFNWELCRHASLAATTLPHVTAEDTIFCGYFIPRGTIVFGNLHSMYQDATIFSEPDTFSPERFLSATGEFRNELLQDIPMFGLGRRRCLGEPLARYLMQLFTVRLVTNCHISEHPNHPLVLGTGIFNLIFAPQPYKVIVQGRQP